MTSLYIASVWLHVVAAMAWVGGMIFIVAVLVPMIRAKGAPERAEIMSVAGRRFRVVGWVALVTLVVTGVFNVLYRGYRFEHFFTGDVFQGAWGRTLAHKLGVVAIVLVMSALHDFWLGPKASKGDAKEREKWRRVASVMGRVTFALSLLIVALAVTLVR